MHLQKFAEFGKVQAYMYLNFPLEDEKWPLIFLLWVGGKGLVLHSLLRSSDKIHGV